MARYDSHVIYYFTDELYARADLIIIVYTGIGGLIGAFLGYMVGEIVRGGGLLTVAIGLAVVGAIGYFIGNGKAFELRVQAQTLLCQVAIEENTRKLSGLAEASQENVPAAANTRQSTNTPIASSTVASSSGRRCRECGADLPRYAEHCPKCLAIVS